MFEANMKTAKVVEHEVSLFDIPAKSAQAITAIGAAPCNAAGARVRQYHADRHAAGNKRRDVLRSGACAIRVVRSGFSPVLRRIASSSSLKRSHTPFIANRKLPGGARFDTRVRPESLFAEYFGKRSNGSISVRKPSSMTGAFILASPSFEGRVAANRDSKQSLCSAIGQTSRLCLQVVIATVR